MVVSNVMTRKINNFAVLVSMSIFNVPLKMNEMSVEIWGSGFEELCVIFENEFYNYTHLKYYGNEI